MMTEEQRKLVEDNIKLVGYFISKKYPQFIGNEDIYQIASIGLINAAIKYDASKGSFSHYAGMWIKQSIVTHVTYLSRGKRKGELETISLENEVREGITYRESIGEVDFTEKLIEKEVQDKYLLSALDKLKPRERRMFLLYHINGLRFKQIGELENTTRERARQIVRQAEKVLREELEGVLV